MTGGGDEAAVVQVQAASGGYPVRIGQGLLAQAGARIAHEVPDVRRWAVITDDRVAALYAESVRSSLEARGLAATLHAFPAGERHKTREEWARLSDELLAVGVGRDGGVVAVGGGVTGDLAGFVAATFMRGIPVVQVPTSVVAMVDSAVGGKTGVDTPAGKNLVGAFHPPRLVLVDPGALVSLPRRERAQGWAEAVKHGAIVDEAYFRSLADAAPALLEGDPAAAEAAVLRSIEIKADVVSADEREAGRREILNFGHTLGHALEAASGYRLPHGSAVSVGMVLEARLGEDLGITEAGTAHRLAEVLARFDLPVRPPGPFASGQVADLLLRDKKVREGRVRIVLLEALGRVARDGGWARTVSVEDLGRALARYLQDNFPQAQS